MDWSIIMRFSLLLGSLIALNAATPAVALAQNLVQNGNFALTSYALNNQFGTGFGGQGVTD
jgi:hypothetical protein